MMIRFCDLIFSGLGIVLLTPIFIIVYLLIRLDSKGDPIFRQERMGIYFSKFKLFKFRTMTINHNNQYGLTVGNRDSRITRLGYYLRKYKIDELPQLFNVLKGDMSIVGPRPELEKYMSLYPDDFQIILSVKPGMTDYASIDFSNENEILEKQEDPQKYYNEVILPEKIKLKKIYINNLNIKNYLIIIFKTFSKIIF